MGRMMAVRLSASRWNGASLFGVFCVAVAVQTLLEHLEMLEWCFVLWGAMAILWLPAVLRVGTRLERRAQRPLPLLWLRSPREPRTLSGMRSRAGSRRIRRITRHCTGPGPRRSLWFEHWSWPRPVNVITLCGDAYYRTCGASKSIRRPYAPPIISVWTSRRLCGNGCCSLGCSID